MCFHACLKGQSGISETIFSSVISVYKNAIHMKVCITSLYSSHKDRLKKKWILHYGSGCKER